MNQEFKTINLSLIKFQTKQQRGVTVNDIYKKEMLTRGSSYFFYVDKKNNKAQKRPIINLYMSSAVSVDSTKSTVTYDVYQQGVAVKN